MSETRYEKLANDCEALLIGASGLFDEGAKPEDMWFHELSRHLKECEKTFRELSKGH